jgi:hypothetical protein
MTNLYTIYTDEQHDLHDCIIKGSSTCFYYMNGHAVLFCYEETPGYLLNDTTRLTESEAEMVWLANGGTSWIRASYLA